MSLASDESMLIGSERWVRAEERWADRNDRRFDRSRALAHAFRSLVELEAGLANGRINGGGETETGKAIHHDLANYIELTAALATLTEYQRDCWLLFAVDGLSCREIAARLGGEEEAVRRTVARARGSLEARIYDPQAIAF